MRRLWPIRNQRVENLNGSNRCNAVIDPSVSNPILHTTDHWFTVPGNPVLHEFARFQGAVEYRVSSFKLQMADAAMLLRANVPVAVVCSGCCRLEPKPLNFAVRVAQEDAVVFLPEIEVSFIGRRRTELQAGL